MKKQYRSPKVTGIDDTVALAPLAIFSAATGLAALAGAVAGAAATNAAMKAKPDEFRNCSLTAIKN